MPPERLWWWCGAPTGGSAHRSAPFPSKSRNRLLAHAGAGAVVFISALWPASCISARMCVRVRTHMCCASMCLHASSKGSPDNIATRKQFRYRAARTLQAACLQVVLMHEMKRQPPHHAGAQEKKRRPPHHVGAQEKKRRPPHHAGAQEMKQLRPK